jgi:hypothetical protein
VVRLGGVEPPTLGLEVRRSILLSYRRSLPYDTPPGAVPTAAKLKATANARICHHMRVWLGHRFIADHPHQTTSGPSSAVQGGVVKAGDLVRRRAMTHKLFVAGLSSSASTPRPRPGRA